ncbi:MAG: YceH family protein [Acidimicrobiales bacterium]
MVDGQVVDGQVVDGQAVDGRPGDGPTVGEQTATVSRKPLTPVQIRLLGCLLEKERTTPDLYPLTMNGLLAAANQSSNRNPVMDLAEITASSGLSNLRAEGLIRVVYSRSNRAERYRQVLDEALAAGEGELAALSVLMLRGPQTSAEIRSRCERLYAFDTNEGLEKVLAKMAERAEPLVRRLPPRPGQKEARWEQCLGDSAAVESVPTSRTSAVGAGAVTAGLVERVAALEARIDTLVAALIDLGLDLPATPGDPNI